MSSLKQHPHKYSLDLLKITIDRLPPGVPEDQVETAQTSLEQYLADFNVSAEAIETKIAEIGKISWPYRKAYQDILEERGQPLIESLFQSELRPDVRASFGKWLASGHTMADVKKGHDIEKAFSADERYVIEEALLKAEDEVDAQIRAQIGAELKVVFWDKVKFYEERQKVIDEKIQALRALAHDAPKWASEILGKASLLEEGWSVVSRDPEEYEIEKDIEYWQGVLASEAQSHDE